MSLQDVQGMPLWEQVAESGRFTECALSPGLSPWRLVGRAMMSGLTFMGSAAEFVHVSDWQPLGAAGTPAAAAGRLVEQHTAPMPGEILPLDAEILKETLLASHS